MRNSGALRLIALFAAVLLCMTACGQSGKTDNREEVAAESSAVQQETAETAEETTEAVEETTEAPVVTSAAETEAEISQEVPMADDTVPDTDGTVAQQPKRTAQLSQVLPCEDGSVAVLYSDGSVTVSGNEHLAREVSDWEGVTRLYDHPYSPFEDRPILVGLTDRDVVLTTEEDLYGWSDVEKIAFSYEDMVGIAGNGQVYVYGDSDYSEQLAELKGVKDMFFAAIDMVWGVVKKNGDVYLVSDYADPEEVRCRNVRELRNAGHTFYTIRNDGKVTGLDGDIYAGLNGAVKVVDSYDWVFGLSKNGRLLTYNGGSIYTNTGDMMVDVPGLDYYGEEVDIRQFDQIADIVSFWGLILLNRDGTAEHIGAYPHWDLSAWNGVQKVCGCDAGEYKINLYGIQRDGSVAVNQYDTYHGEQTVITQYRDWILQDIYAGEEGVVGLTTDGQLVGDGIYENVDFSVFE